MHAPCAIGGAGYGRYRASTRPVIGADRGICRLNLPETVGPSCTRRPVLTDKHPGKDKC